MAHTVNVIHTNKLCDGIAHNHFYFDNELASLVIAYISPHVDFQDAIREIKSRSGDVRILGITTAGELCSLALENPLYVPDNPISDSVVLQIFPPDLLADIDVYTIPLFNEDIRNGSFTLEAEKRRGLIENHLKTINPKFTVDAKDTVALTFVDGLSSSENYLMEAIYNSKKFPCLFIGGSSGAKADLKSSYLYDGENIVENHAVIAFLKIAEGRTYGVLKSQNFEEAGLVLEIADADTDRRIVSAVFDKKTNARRPFAHYLSEILGVELSELGEYFKRQTFAIKLNEEFYVRSVCAINTTTGAISFYCDINQGDALHLVRAIDFERKTAEDISNFLSARPPALGAMLNDCILRRVNNDLGNCNLPSKWPAPVAGFSTFGEIFGINVNQTLSALVFFDISNQPHFVDPFIAQFPILYASYSNYFSMRRAHAQLNLELRTNSQRSQQVQNVALSQSLDMGLVTISSSGIILMVNKAAESMFGYSISEMLGNNVNMLMPEPHRSMHDQYIANYMQTGKAKIPVAGGEVIARRKDGTTFPMHLTVTKLMEQGEVCFVGICRDISDQKLQEAALESEKKAALDASKAKSSFLAHMSHELRTPLNGLLGMLQLMDVSNLSDEQCEIIGNAKLSGKTLLEIVNDVLDLSKIEASGLTLESIGVDMRELIGQVTKTLRPLADKKAIKIHEKIDADFPFILADPVRVKQVITNLVGNAVKYTLQGSVWMEISVVTKGKDSVRFRIDIRDTGIGIPADKLHTIFESFSQVDLSTTRRFGGTGLGLSITKMLVEAMGGTIGVNSVEGQGSNFWCEFTFPITASLFDSRFQAQEIVKKGDKSPADIKILIAEDILMNVLIIKKVMKKFGITNVKFVENGKQVMESFVPGKWDIVLMDCFMPEMNGYDATKAIRTREKGTLFHVPIIAMTANAMEGDKEMCLRSGMDFYLPKPLDLDELKLILSQWIDFPEDGIAA